MKVKTFDCVEMKRRGAERVQQQIAGMTQQQEMDFWRERTEETRRCQQEVRRKLSPKSS